MYAQMDLVLVIDESGSIRGDSFDYSFEDTLDDNWFKIRNFIIKVSQHIEARTNGGVLAGDNFKCFSLIEKNVVLWFQFHCGLLQMAIWNELTLL